MFVPDKRKKNSSYIQLMWLTLSLFNLQFSSHEHVHAHQWKHDDNFYCRVIQYHHALLIHLSRVLLPILSICIKIVVFPLFGIKTYNMYIVQNSHYTSVEHFIPLNTQTANKLIMMTLMTLKWSRMRYTVSYHNSRLWGTLHTTGGIQEVHKADTNI